MPIPLHAKKQGIEGLSGVELIAAERGRQIAEENYTPEHDAQHRKGQLANAAACYAALEPIYVERKLQRGISFVSPWPHYWVSNVAGRGEGWYPWPRSEADRITRLVRAGALIAAEVDRLLASAGSTGT